jgi:hypothetical protein
MRCRDLFLLSTILASSLVANAQEETAAPSAAEAFGATMGIGAVTIDGQTWTQIALRPEIPIGKLGIALDLVLYFDENGDIRKEDWDEGRDLIDKIYYLRWGHRGDPVYLRAGALDNVTLGYGMLVRHYSNTMEYPAKRRLGGEFDFRLGLPHVEGFIADFAELDDPGLIGLRATYPILGKLRIGAGIVHDGNLFNGMADADDDGVPDGLDRYEDYDDQQEWDYWHGLEDNLDGTGYWDQVRESASYPGDAWLGNDVPSYADVSESVTAISADLSYELLPNLDLYMQAASFSSLGTGYAPGARFRPASWFEMGAEYRVWGEQFIGEFFDRSYDLERSLFKADSLYSKKELLKHAPAMKGFYADAHFNAFNLITASAAWNSMTPDEGDTEDWNSLRAQASLNLAKVPKLSELSAYYQQVGVESLFELKSESTVHGIRLGYEIAPGANMNLNWQTSYEDINGDGLIEGDDEKVKRFLVETVFRLK